MSTVPAPRVPCPLLMCLLLACAIGPSFAAAPLDLTPFRAPEWLAQHLDAGRIGRSYPAIADRAAWSRLPAHVRLRRVDQAAARLGSPWPTLTASMALESAKTGSSAAPYNLLLRDVQTRLYGAVIAECIENEGRFLPEIADGLWWYCERSSWITARHTNMQRAGRGLADVTDNVLDIAAAESGQQLAWIVYVLGERLDTVSPLLRPRVVHELNRRVLQPFLERDDLWWMGGNPERELNNWTPWIVGNTLACAYLTEPDRDRQIEITRRALLFLQRYFDRLPADGACDEGPSYWLHSAGSVLVAFDLLHTVSDGAFAPYGNPWVEALGNYILDAHIDGLWFVNFADAPVSFRPDGSRLFRFGRQTRNSRLMAFGANLLGVGQDTRDTWPDNPARMIVAVADAAFITTTDPAIRHRPQAWYPDTQILMLRTDQDGTGGVFLAAKGGHNAERHNHNDVGQFILHVDGLPVIVDPGVGTYTNETFGPERYTIWTMQSAYHNLPTINGTLQSAGRHFATRDVRYSEAGGVPTLTLDLAPAYPPEAAVTHWQRRLALEPSGHLLLAESFALTHRQGITTLNLMTPCEADLGTPGIVRLTPFGPKARGCELRFDPSVLEVAVDVLPLTDQRLSQSWGPTLRRLRFIWRDQTALSGRYEISFVPVFSSP